jgi:hypothetical protein
VWSIAGLPSLPAVISWVVARLHPPLVFVQGRNDLFFRMSLSFHRSVRANSENSNSIPMISWSKVTISKTHTPRNFRGAH